MYFVTRFSSLALFIGCLALYAPAVRSATVNAASCTHAAVQAAITTATDGDTVNVPAGSCTWQAFTLTKAIHLKGPGSSQSSIGLSGTLGIAKNARGSTRLSGFTFSNAGTSTLILVTGPAGGPPPMIHDNVFTVNAAGVMKYETNGGVIYRNVFRSTRPLSNGLSDDEGIQHKMPQAQAEAEWRSADTMGTRDQDGRRNLYVEDNVFENMATQSTDFDDGARVVFRYNRLVNAGFNSHGLDTSPAGLRHFEIYGNSFQYPDPSKNQVWMIWIRGATGVVFNNDIANITGSTWGDKSEIQFSVRMANDGGVRGCATSYPAPHQVGQNHDGTRQFTDPVYFWGNTGSTVWEIREWPNTCGQNINDYLRPGRDFVFASVPKPGYMPYAYPHPARAAVAPPSPPSGLRATP